MRNRKGFTLVELAVVTSIFVTLLGFITITLVRSQQVASLTSVEEILLADLKQQQLKAMIGDTEGRDSSGAYGISFDETAYTMFYGTYVVGEPTNSQVNLPQNFQFESPGTNILFQKISGEISVDSTSSAVLKDTTNGNTKTVKMNQYGVIKEID